MEKAKMNFFIIMAHFVSNANSTYLQMASSLNGCHLLFVHDDDRSK
ncbi:hypothetical protein X975_26673, partial [Stegodyphus mimosarum]